MSGIIESQISRAPALEAEESEVRCAVAGRSPRKTSYSADSTAMEPSAEPRMKEQFKSTEDRKKVLKLGCYVAGKTPKSVTASQSENDLRSTAGR